MFNDMFDVQKVSKALAAFVATSLVAFLASKGVTFTNEVQGALGLVLDAVVAGVLGYVVVWLAPKNKV